MTVPAHIQQRVEARIEQCLKIAESTYGREFETPVVQYNLRGKVAGYAHLAKNTVSFNHLYLMNQTDLFIERTVAHEVAHLLCFALYPDIHCRAFGRKASFHGDEWRSIMIVLGAPTSRCHNYDQAVIAKRASNRVQYTYKCNRCGEEYTLGAKRHARLQHQPTCMWCRCSRMSRLELVRAPVAVDEAKKTSTPIGTIKVFPTAEVKSLEERSLIIFQTNRSLAQSVVIKKIATDMNITNANARYYYMKFVKKGY